MIEPRRLRDSAERPTSVEGRLARQLRILSVYAPVPQLRRYSAVPRRRRVLLLTLRIAAVAAVVLAVSGVATATVSYVVHRVWPNRATVEPAPESDRRQRGQRSRLPQRAAKPAAALEPRPQAAIAGGLAPVVVQPAEAVDSPPSPRSRPTLDKRPAETSAELRGQLEAAPVMRAPAVEPPPLPSLPAVAALPAPSGPTASQVRADGLSQEAGLLRQALSALRREHDARRALLLLDDYDRRFGQGTLAPEATSARAQALLELGDRARALDLLDRLPLSQDGHARELRVIRGELRSVAGRCADALRDFDRVLRGDGTPPDEVARALFGRASCRLRMGDVEGAAEDRRRYLKEFPQGPAAPQLMSSP